MATPQEHEALYARLRQRILGRHFALGRYFRTNLVSINNTLEPEPPGSLNGLPESEQDTIRRWRVGAHQRENPLLWSGRLLAAVAAEHELGQPDAVRILTLALDTIGSLYPINDGGHFDGYLNRWDPATSDAWVIGPNGPERNEEFLCDEAGQRYLGCVPFTDPRYVPNRDPGSRAQLFTSSQRAQYDFLESDYFESHRVWEASMDELVGLMCTYAVVHELVPDDAVRQRIRAQAERLGDYLGEHAYLLVRPQGGLNRRGATGMLPALEYSFDRVFARVTGTTFASRTDFVGAMGQAGYWRLLAGPVDRVAAAATVVGILAAPGFDGLLAALGPLRYLIAPILSVASPVTQVAQAALPFVGPALPRSLGLFVHADVFDVSERGEPALAHLLLAIPPPLRFLAYTAGMSAGGSGIALSFAPYLGLSALGDSDGLVGDEYLRLMRDHLSVPVTPGRTDRLDSCFASAVALLLGAGQAEEARLVEMLDAHHASITAVGPECLRIDTDAGGRHEAIDPGLDYLAGLALAWLHARRSAAAGAPVNTAGFPQPPADPASWPRVTVPAAVLEHVPQVRALVGSPALGQDVDLFATSGVPLAKPASVPLRLPPEPQTVAQQVSVTVRDTDGDVATGVVVNPGEIVEISATGTITAPEFLAQPSGPDGWYIVDDARFPLHSGIDPTSARKYALLARLGGYFFVGSGPVRHRIVYHRPLPLHLRVNIDEHRGGAGVGAFEVSVTVWGELRRRALCTRFEVDDIAGVRAVLPVGVSMRNAGTAGWTGAAGYRLVLAGGQDVWGIREVALPGDIAPGEQADFAFSVTCPATPGSYEMSWAVAATGQEPLEQSTPLVTVTVTATARCAVLLPLLSSIPAEIALLREDYAGASPAQKAAITRQINALESRLGDVRREAADLGCSG